MTEEDKLVQKAIAGDRQSLEIVIKLWSPRIRRFATRFCPTTELLDAVQETLLIMANRISTLRSVKAIGSWSFQVVKRLCIRVVTALRKQDRLARHLETLSSDSFTPHENEKKLLGILTEAVNDLPPLSRTVLLLRDMEGLSTEETATQTGLGTTAVKSRVHRARDFVRKRLLMSLKTP